MTSASAEARKDSLERVSALVYALNCLEFSIEMRGAEANGYDSLAFETITDEINVMLRASRIKQDRSEASSPKAPFTFGAVVQEVD